MIHKKSGSYWRENWRTSLALWAGKQGIVTLLLYIVSLLAYFGFIRNATEGWIQITLGIASAAWFPFLMLVIVPRKMWFASQDQIEQYKEKFKPKLKMFFEPRGSCVQTGADPEFPTAETQLFRVCVENISGVTIDDVQVRLVEMSGGKYSFLPVTLQIMNHPKVEIFSLHAGEKEFIDVIQRSLSGSGETQVALQTILGPVFVQFGPHVLTLSAFGRNVQSATEKFFMTRTAAELLVFREDSC